MLLALNRVQCAGIVISCSHGPKTHINERVELDCPCGVCDSSLELIIVGHKCLILSFAWECDHLTLTRICSVTKIIDHDISSTLQEITFGKFKVKILGHLVTPKSIVITFLVENVIEMSRRITSSISHK